ncbi:hypothetical protein A2U01_0083427, partial [Trifolium medium]|nr:hypothetical protein [Trifolium medium]
VGDLEKVEGKDRMVVVAVGREEKRLKMEEWMKGKMKMVKWLIRLNRSEGREILPWED